MARYKINKKTGKAIKPKPAPKAAPKAKKASPLKPIFDTVDKIEAEYKRIRRNNRVRRRKLLKALGGD